MGGGVFGGKLGGEEGGKMGWAGGGCWSMGCRRGEVV